MSDWITRAAERKRRKEEEVRRKEEKLLAEEARRKYREEENRIAKQRWLEQNMISINSVYQLIETHMSRAEDAGFRVSFSRSRDGLKLSIYGDKNRRIDFVPDYEDGFEVIFIIYRPEYDEEGGTCYKEKKKKRNYPFNKIPEGKILYWVKLVATGKRPFWLV
jgi:hypothetical protein